jgi:hypothetical protein
MIRERKPLEQKARERRRERHWDSCLFRVKLQYVRGFLVVPR